MEKTIRILKQEAYLEGYKDARDMVAQEIENTTIFIPHIGINGVELTDTAEIMNDLRARYVAIASGKTERR